MRTMASGAATNVMHSGWMVMETARAWERRYFVLTTSSSSTPLPPEPRSSPSRRQRRQRRLARLLCFLRPGDQQPVAGGVLDLTEDGGVVVESKDDMLLLRRAGREPLFFSTDDAGAARGWAAALTRAASPLRPIGPASSSQKITLLRFHFDSKFGKRNGGWHWMP